MPLQIVRGDLFLSGAQTLAHGCNTRGRMGAGIAVAFKERFPDMFRDYRRQCRNGTFQPGQIALYPQQRPWVLNLATQDSLGGARLEYVRSCFSAISEDFGDLGIRSLAMPRIAAGLGGLEWEAVLDLAYAWLDPLEIPIIFYEEFLPGVRAREVLERSP